MTKEEQIKLIRIIKEENRLDFFIKKMKGYNLNINTVLDDFGFDILLWWIFEWDKYNIILKKYEKYISNN